MNVDKDLLMIPMAILCFIISYITFPYCEMYEGTTGYVYQYGWFYLIVNRFLIVIGIIFLSIPSINRLREIS